VPDLRRADSGVIPACNVGIALHSQQPDTLLGFPATWRSGYAAACKAVYTGSIPVVAFAVVVGVPGRYQACGGAPAVGVTNRAPGGS
jgi:hypothetical protein